MDFPQLIVDQGFSVAGEASNVGTGVVQNLGNRLRAEIIPEDSYVAGTPGEEINLLAAVDGKEVGRSIVRNLDRVQSRKRGDPDGAGAAAAVVSPRDECRVVESECGSQRRVGYVRAVRRHLARLSRGQRQARSHTTLGGNGIKLRVAARRFARGAKQNPLSVRSPSDG